MWEVVSEALIDDLDEFRGLVDELFKVVEIGLKGWVAPVNGHFSKRHSRSVVLALYCAVFSLAELALLISQVRGVF